MSITCSLSQLQIENLYANVYVHMRDKGVDFSSEEYMKELFEKISKKKDTDTASKFLQQVPEIIRSIATNRKEIQSFRIKTDSLLDIIDSFKNIDAGLNNVIEYFNPSESLEVKKELVNKNADDAFDVEEVSSDKIETAETNYQPYSVYTTSLEEFVTQDPNKKTEFETQDPGKITIFKTLGAIKKELESTSDFENFKYQNRTLKLKPVKLSEVKPGLLDKTTKDLLIRANVLKSKGIEKSYVTTPDNIFLMIISDKNGYIYFDKDGNISDEASGGTIVYQFLRDVKKNDQDIYRVTDIYDRSNQIATPQEIANASDITVEEATLQQQKDFKDLYDFKQKLIKSTDDVLLDIEGISNGIAAKAPLSLSLSNVTDILEDDDAAIRSISVVTSERADVEQGVSEIEIKGELYTIDRPNLTSDIAAKIADILTNQNISNEKKYNFVSQFLSDKASQKNRKHKLEYLKDTKELIYSYSPTTFQEGISEFKIVTLKDPGAAKIIYDSLMEASGTKGRYYSAKMTYNKALLDKNEYDDYDMVNKVIFEKTFDYIALLKTLPNTTIGLNVLTAKKKFNRYILFSIPNKDSKELSEIKDSESSPEDFFESLVSETEDTPAIYGIKKTKDELVKLLKTGKELTGTIGFVTGSTWSLKLNNFNNQFVKFYNKDNNITNDDVNSVATLNLIEETEFNGKVFTDVIEVRIGDKLIGYVAETETFETPETSDTTVSEKTLDEEIDDLNKEISNINDTDTDTAITAMFRKGTLSSDVSQEQIDDALLWWKNSQLNKYISFNQIANIVNSDAFAKFTAYGSTLNGNLGIIEIADKGSMVDVYHEAWHGFTQLFLTNADKKALYKEVRRKLGGRKSFFEIEEILAEDFRTYAMNPKVKKDSPKRNSIFRKILNYLREVFGLGSVNNVMEIESVTEMFDKLYLNKDLNKYTPLIKNVMFDKLERNNGVIKLNTKDEIALTKQESNQLSTSMDSIISEIVNAVVSVKKSKAAVLSILKEPKLYLAVELKLQSALKNSIEKLESLENIEKNLNSIEALEYRIKVLRAGLENYGNPKEGLVKYHIANSAYGLKKQKYDFTKFDEENEALDKVENSERFGDVKNLGKSILELADEETVYILKSLFAGSINKETNAIEYEFDELGFKKLADFRNTWNSTVRLIGGVQDPQDMYNKLLGDSKANAQIKQLIENKIANPKDKTEGPGTYEYKATTSIWQTFSKSKIPFIQLTMFKEKIGETVKINAAGEISRTPVYEYNAVPVVASDDISKLIKKFQSKFKYDLENKYVDVIGVNNKPTLNLQKIVDDFGIDGKFNKDKSYDFAKAIGFDLDNIDIIKRKLTENNENIEKFGLPFLFSIIKKLNTKDKENSTDSKVIKLIQEFKEDPIQVFQSGIPAGIIGDIVDVQRTVVKALAKLQMDFGIETSMNMVLNAERNLVSEVIENNSISKQVYALNNVGKLSELWTSDKYQHMKYLDPRINPYTKSLGTIRSLFEMSSEEQRKRKGRSLLLFQDSGTQIEDTNDGMNTTNLDGNSKFLQEMHLMLKGGVQEFMRHAGKSASFGAKVDGGIVGARGKEGSENYLWIDSEMFTNGTAYDYAFTAHMLPYLKAEAQRIYMFKQNKNEFTKYIGYNQILENGKYAGEQFTAFDNVLTDSVKNNIYELIDSALAENKMLELNDTELLSKIKDDVKNYFKEQSEENLKYLNEANYVDKELTSKMKNLNVKDENINKKLIETYTYNSWIQNFEMAILFYGDLSQYDHAKEELHKRNPGSTSNGRSMRTDLAARLFVNDTLSNTSYAKQNLKKTIVYDGTFNTAIVQDVLRDSVYINQIEKGLRKDYEERYKDKNIPNKKSEIDRRVNIEVDKYKNMVEGDGGGYITFDAYRTLKYLENDWSDEQEALFQKVSTGAEINLHDVINFFPAYKLQNYGALANTGLPVTAMHKFALFPLIPSAIENSDLKLLHEQMMEKNIQYLTFQSGSKVGSVTQFKNDKNEYIADPIYDKDLKSIKKDITFTENKIYLEYLKNVTAVPNKFKNKTVFATQLRKLILNGLYKNGNISKKNEQVIRNYENSVDNYSAILRLELLQEIDYEYDPVTETYKGNLKDFLDLVQRELEDKNIPDHLIEFIGLNQDNTLKTDLSLHLMADEIESIFVNLIEKRIIKQKIKGEALVQVPSSMTNGLWDRNFKKATESDILKFIGTNNLPFYNSDTASGKTAAMKVAIAIQGDFVNLYKLKHLDGQSIGTRARLNDMIKEDAWLDLNNNRKSITLSAVRIPVQGLNSMEFMEVYEFLDPSAGNIIIPPTEIVTKSGTDYDIDKLTTFMPNIDSSGNYVQSRINNQDLIKQVKNLNKTIEGKKKAFNIIKIQKASIENELLASIKGILELPENYANLVRPNDTYLLKDDIADKLEDFVSEYDRFKNMHKAPYKIKKDKKIISPTRTLEVGYNLHKHVVNIASKRVLGLIAVENALHPIFNQMGMSLPKTYKNQIFDEKTNKYIDDTSKIKGKEKEPNLYRLLLPHNKIDGGISLSGIDSVDGQDNIADIFSQMMNGAVDAEKNPWIFFMQGNYETIPMITFLIKAGVPREHAIYFVSNPLVRAYAKEQQKIKSAYSKIYKVVDEKHKDTFTKFKAAENVIEKFELTGSAKQSQYYASAVNASKRLKIANDGEFDLSKMKELVENPNSEALKPLAEAMFFHFIELEKSTRSFTALKFLANPDTKTEKTLNEIRSKVLAIEELKESTTLKEGTVDALLNSVLGSFFNKNIISDLIEPLFELTNNPEVSDFIDSKIKLNPIDISRMFGKGVDGHSRFIKDFKKAIPNYIYQNYRSNFVDGQGNIVSFPKEYNGYIVKEKKGVKNGVEIADKILYVDTEALKNQFDNNLFLRSNTDDLGYTKMGLRGFDVSLKIFPNESSYFKYVFERESLRKMFPFKTINLNNEFKNINKNISDPKEAYESFLNQKALINAYNRVGLMELDTQSYTDQVLNVIAEFPALKSKYSILQQLTRVPGQIKENILTINEPKSLKDSNISDTFYENLVALGDVNVKKVKNTKDNKRISDIFSKLPSIMLYQHGVGYSKHGFTKALPYDDFINIMQPASKIFINNQLNEETLESIYSMLMASDKSFVNYVVSSKEYNDAEVSKSVNLTPAEARALLESGSIGVDEDIDDEEEPTQTSTSVEKVIYDNNGLTIIENGLSEDFAKSIVPDLVKQIESQSYKQTKSASSYDFGTRWTRMSDNLSKDIKLSFVTGMQLSGYEITKEKLDRWVAGETGAKLGLPPYGYNTLDQYGEPLRSIPSSVIIAASNATGIDLSTYQASYNSVYDNNDQGNLIFHQDNTEQISDAPIVTLSLGLPMRFIAFELKNESDYSLNNQFIADPTIPTASTALKNKFINPYGDSFILSDRTVLVFDGKNRNVGHKIQFDPTLKGTMPDYLPEINVNKAFTGLNQEDRYVKTKDYRTVLTLRKIKDDGIAIKKFDKNTQELIYKNGVYSIISKFSTRPSINVKGTLPGPETKINIYDGTGENAELSNFANRPFTGSILGGLGGLDFINVEQAFQYNKGIYYNTRAIDPSSNDTPDTMYDKVEAHLETILNAKTGAEAKALGKKQIGVEFNNYDWDQDSSSIMKTLIKESFQQNPNALEKLLATGDATLTHTQDKNKWGKEFPRLLMEVRDELKTTQSATDVDFLNNIQTGRKPDVNIKEKYFKNSDVVKVSEVLNKIAESNHPLNKLAQQLKSFANINDTDIALYNQVSFNNNPNFLSGGYYDPINNSISIAEFANVKNGQSETLLLHEILHALSYNALRTNNVFNKDFKKLYDSTIEQLGMYNAESLEGLYGTYTIDEFFVALFTDSKFIKELENLAPININKYNNMFEEIFDYILKLLNITKNNSLYSQAFSVATNILEDTNNESSMLDTNAGNINDNSLNYNKPEGLPAIDRTSTECS